MNNSYYHEFTIGFNMWYVVLPFVLAFITFLGTRRYYLESETMRIKTRGKKLTTATLVAIISSVLTITGLMMYESFNGLVQFLTNLLAKNDSPAWAVIIVGTILILAVPYALFNLFVRAAKTGEYYQLGRLTERRREIKKRKTVITFFNQNQ